MNYTSNSGLTRLYAFFEKYGTERLDGLDRTYFNTLTPSEKEEAWNFLKLGFPTSYERIIGLYELDRSRALPIFKAALNEIVENPSYPSEREQAELSRLLMLSYVIRDDPSKQYFDALTEFAHSDFADIRGEFARALPTQGITPEAVQALKKMIFTETETIPRTSAIKKLMSIHGLKFKLKDSLYDSIYLALRSDDPKDKLSAMAKLEAIQEPNYL